MNELSCQHGSEQYVACADEFPVGRLLPGTSLITRSYRFMIETTNVR